MKLSKEELKQKISENIKENDDLVIELLEDIDDSFSDGSNDEVQIETLRKENEDLKMKYEDIKTRYKERFLSPAVEEKEEEKVEETTDSEGLQEEEVIDVKEI